MDRNKMLLISPRLTLIRLAGSKGFSLRNFSLLTPYQNRPRTCESETKLIVGQSNGVGPTRGKMCTALPKIIVVKRAKTGFGDW